MADAAPQQQLADAAPTDTDELQQAPPPADAADGAAAAGGGATAAGDSEETAAEGGGGAGSSSTLLEGEEDARRQEEARAAQLAARPFGEQMAEVMANLKLKSHAAEAVRFLSRLLDARPAEIAAQPGLVDLLSRIIADGPALPAAGGAMAALARLCLEPGPRARVRSEAAVTPVVRFLSLADPDKSANAEAAALLIMNLASDRLARRALIAAGAVEALLSLLPKLGSAHTSPLACYVAGALMVLATADEGGRGAARFVEAGGIEATCQALAERRLQADSSRGTLRLRLLLAELCRANKGWEARAHAAAADLAAGARASLAGS